MREFAESDIPALLDIFRDEEVCRFIPMFPLRNMDDAVHYFREHCTVECKAEWFLYYAICLRDENIPLGCIHVASDDSHDLGYGFRKDVWHRGIATEACRAIVGKIREEKQIPYITATHDINNPESGAVIKKIGMSYRYSYEERWQPKDILVTFRMYQLDFWGESKNLSKVLEYISGAFCGMRFESRILEWE